VAAVGKARITRSSQLEFWLPQLGGSIAVAFGDRHYGIAEQRRCTNRRRGLDAATAPDDGSHDQRTKRNEKYQCRPPDNERQSLPESRIVVQKHPLTIIALAVLLQLKA
jgi:hypothetical protein